MQSLHLPSVPMGHGEAVMPLTLELDARGGFRRPAHLEAERLLQGGVAEVEPGVQEAAGKHALTLEEERLAHLAEEEPDRHRGKWRDRGAA